MPAYDFTNGSTVTVMAGSSLFGAVILLPLAFAFGDRMLPETTHGWMVLGGLALFVCSITAPPLRAAGEWNESRIVVKRPRVEHWLNGKLVVTAAVADGAPKRSAIQPLIGTKTARLTR